MKGLSAKTLSAAAALSLAALGATGAHAAGVEILNEGFDDVGGLSGWTQANNSVPAGNGWFQGNAELFPAQAGASDSYAAANFLSAAGSGGSVDNWLITPTLDLAGPTLLNFYTRADATPGFNELVEVRLSNGGSDPSDFTTLLTTIGNTGGYPTDWAFFSVALEADGPARFAFRYLGPADTLNYVGLDTVSVVTAVPEPSTWMMLALGLGGFGLLRRRQPS